MRFGRLTKFLGPNNYHRRPGVHLVGRLAAEADNKRASITPAE